MCRLMVNLQLLRSVFQHHGQLHTLLNTRTRTHWARIGPDWLSLFSVNLTGSKMSDSRHHRRPKVTWFPLNTPRQVKEKYCAVFLPSRYNFRIVTRSHITVLIGAPSTDTAPPAGRSYSEFRPRALWAIWCHPTKTSLSICKGS